MRRGATSCLPQQLRILWMEEIEEPLHHLGWLKLVEILEILGETWINHLSNRCWISSIFFHPQLREVRIPVGTPFPGSRRHGAYWSGGGGRNPEPMELGKPQQPLAITSLDPYCIRGMHKYCRSHNFALPLYIYIYAHTT